jgi:hypothetical protein
MTPKEKAKELVDKYATYVVMWAGDINTTHQNCKKCALIAVDEIISVIGESYDIDHINYWQEVKQEIESL